MSERLDIQTIAQRANEFNTHLAGVKSRVQKDGLSWYPYDSLGSFFELARVLTGPRRSLLDLIGSGPVLDIGCGDGDVSFFLESLGVRMRAIDNPPTNFNGMRGVRELKAALGSRVEIAEMDIDSQFQLDGGPYGAVFLFGILYHLKNPIFVLETLARHARYILLTTRVARFTPDGRTGLRDLPVGYLLSEGETNRDATNYWIFSEAGLRRLLDVSGWEICDYMTLGNTASSDPRTWQGDERAFCFASSRLLNPAVGPVSTPDFELRSGWHGLEEGSWRWTERCFSIRANRAGVLRLKLWFSEDVLAGRGTVTLSAGKLPSGTYSAPGRYVWEAEVPAGVVEFELDKAFQAGTAEDRELGVVVWSITFEPHG